MAVVDSHTHFMPGRLARKIRAFFEEHLADDLAYDVDPEATLGAMRSEGVTCVWNLPYAHKAGMAAQLNQSVVELSASVRRPGLAVVAGCTVHPADDDPASVLEDAHARGARVLKLHCSVGDYSLEDRRLADTLALAGELAVPVVVHAGHGVDGGTHHHELDQIERTAPRHPGTRFILAHLGHPASARGMELLDAHPNLHVDLTPVVTESVPLERAAAERHRERILFGSDAPNTGRTVTQLLDHLGRVGLSDTAIERITGHNALELVPLEGEAAVG